MLTNPLIHHNGPTHVLNTYEEKRTTRTGLLGNRAYNHQGL